MATISKEDLSARILSGDITAICVDTNIYEAQQFAFHRGIIGEMKNLPVAGLKTLFPDVIEREIVGHMTSKLPEAISALRKAARSASNFGVVVDSAEADLGISDDPPGDIARRRFTQHCADVKGTPIKAADFADVSSVLDSYFDCNPPFEPKKREEFADALSLSSLEGWAKAESTHVFAVTDDNGWKKYCETSGRVHAGPSLSDLLVAIQHTEPAILQRALKAITGASRSDLMAGLADQINGSAIFADAWGQHYVEANVVVADVLDIEVDDLTTDDLELVRNDDNEFVVRLIVTASVEFEVRVRFSVFDSIDRDRVPLGAQDMTHETTLMLESLLTFYRDEDESAQPELETVEIMERALHIDLGKVEYTPDWS